MLSWIKITWQAKEESLVKSVGIDGAMFLRFLKFGTVLFQLLSVPGCGLGMKRID
jgi:hypothetical protein